MPMFRLIKKSNQRVTPASVDKTSASRVVPSPTSPTKHKVTYDLNSKSDNEPVKTRSTYGSASEYEPHHAYVRQSPQPPSRSLGAHYAVSNKPSGHGVAGQVFPCRSLATNRPCAVKTINKSKIRRRDRIRREIAFLREANHANIISLYDVFEDEDNVHIVTELCEGGELFDEIVTRATAGKNDEKLPPCFDESTAMPIIRSLVEAVSYLHCRDIVHRDIKPENVLFAKKDNLREVKLIDFGLSTRHGKYDPPLKNTVGTSYYMDPALLAGSYDRSCDMWSIGVIAFVMLCGRPPFNGSNDETIFRKIKRGGYKMNRLWDGISENAKDFVRCLLVSDPQQRWTADMALQHPWLK
ncbi:hypothetical protein THAOC_25078 [Thalassiosira oceanica]|uniref:Protein kinase domain-containing protein n=1 Tax=Thalassiosira oceanica TaxID=159749 RepID=K0RSC3_THAOC|nr:hypothetical protein THAOC_25078 [Thalassiosira oceanica]|eukprot:EJK55209.1 hypothetical protein THAOC_25078 [Thalassiosira oceanica]